MFLGAAAIPDANDADKQSYRRRKWMEGRSEKVLPALINTI